MLIFRRAFIDRTLGVVVVEPSPGSYLYLPGTYDPDQMLIRLIRRRFIDPKHWAKFPPKSS